MGEPERTERCLDCGLPITGNSDTLCNDCYERQERKWEKVSEHKTSFTKEEGE